MIFTHLLQIGDFGMARDIENDYYKSHGGIIPVKWTAPEVRRENVLCSLLHFIIFLPVGIELQQVFNCQ